MHKIIIDGYNLLYAMPGLLKYRKRKLETARERLLNKLAAVGKRRRTFIVVVFDGVQDEILPTTDGINKWVQVRFSPPHKKADLIIVELAQAEARPRSCTVVSSDKAVIREVASTGMKTMTSEDFALILEPKRRLESEPEEPPKPEMTPADLEVWKRVFGR